MIRSAAAALALPFRAAPALAAVTLALTVLAGAGPAVSAWLTGLLVDELTSGAASTGLAAVLVVWPPMVPLLLICPATAVLARLATAWREASTEESWVAADRRRLFYRALLTDVRAAKEIRLFGLGNLLRARMVDSLTAVSGARLAADRPRTLAQGALALLGPVVGGTGTVVVAVGVGSGRASVGDLVLFLGTVAGVQGGVSGVVLQLGVGSGRAVRLFGRYLDVLATPDDLPQGRETPSGQAEIRFHDVWFRYRDDGPWVLRGVDLAIPAGAAVGLVGVNGAGKSALVKLLCRFYDPQRGSITWGGVDLRELDLAALRARIGVVFQEFTAYDLTAAENIGIGQVNALGDRGRVTRAAIAARVDDVVDALPDGYDTLLSRTHADGGRTGVTLSGGQWQRVALARCLTRDDAGLLVLDEPTSGLDAVGEHRVHETLLPHRIKRVAAVAGDPVPDWLTPTMPGVHRAPAGFVVVAGDNPRSQDSRQLGLVRCRDVVGAVPGV
ncbi:Signal peptidase I [Actinosynnema pretiosum subsp. pretiosum]|nr:Signal peptidase I [Actinosynnema pretiosum subsp. pretiosum]